MLNSFEQTSEMANMLGLKGFRKQSMGVARISQRGGHTLSNRVYLRFRNLNIVGSLSNKRLTKGGSRAPQDPPPFLATPLQS